MPNNDCFSILSMKNILYTAVLLVTCCTTAQSLPKGAESLITTQERQKIDSVKTVDWLAYDYQYLSEDFKIEIPHEVFQKGLKDGKFIKERITKYSDSLSVVLSVELQDQVATRIAGMQINYSWERLGWNLLMTASQAQELGTTLNFNLPYQVKKYLEDTSNQDTKRLKILNSLRTRVAQLEQVTEDVNELSLKNLFNRAFRYSPERLQKVKEIQATRRK